MLVITDGLGGNRGMMLRRRIPRGRPVTTIRTQSCEGSGVVLTVFLVSELAGHPYACRGVETPRTCPKAHGSFVEFETTDSAILFSSP
jgi:hypothetical protein